ncbi:MAG: hypothetical protein ACRBC3_21050 [Burkholderiaceae bacterium]
MDRIDEKDPRSRSYSIADLAEPSSHTVPRSYTWRCNLWLDQGFEGSCVGFAWAHELAARPVEVLGLSAKFARESVYFAAQRHDRFRGGAYPGAAPFAEGTSVLAGAKAVASLGYIDEYRWAFDIQDLIVAVGYRGPAVFGCRWYRDMQKPTIDGVATPTGSRIGKHCVLLNSVKIVRADDGTLDERASFFVFRNSFGKDWGVQGNGILSLESVRALWDDAETCIPVVRQKRPRRSVRKPADEGS